MVITTTGQPNRWPWLMLPARLALFAFWQLVIAIVLVLTGGTNAWGVAAAWWPLTAVLANLACIWLLRALYRQEGARFWDVFRMQRQTMKKDLPALAGGAAALSLFSGVALYFAANFGRPFYRLASAHVPALCPVRRIAAALAAATAALPGGGTRLDGYGGCVTPGKLPLS